jgi:hypothetical protein
MKFQFKKEMHQTLFISVYAVLAFMYSSKKYVPEIQTLPPL